MTRRAALALLLPLALTTACEGGLPDKGVADTMGEETDTGMDETTGTTGAETTGDELPASHEGEDCGGMTAQPCSVGEALGVEICALDTATYETKWSACFLDACDSLGATQECLVGDAAGAQICVKAGDAMVWGECVVGPECAPGESQDCGLGDLEISMGCVVSETGVPHWNWEDCNTPLVLSFDGRAPSFSAPPAAAAAFDVAGAGACTSTDWPSAATPWLARDRDRSGTIDGGHELFGNGTRTASGARADHGFDALRELDSDGDGRVTAADAGWGELVVWADHDGDRRSSGWELLPLEAYGVEAIELGFRRALECDERGNCGVERAAFSFREGGRARVGEVVDVYLACAE